MYIYSHKIIVIDLWLLEPSFQWILDELYFFIHHKYTRHIFNVQERQYSQRKNHRH